MLKNFDLLKQSSKYVKKFCVTLIVLGFPTEIGFITHTLYFLALQL